jgi:acetyl/propionyl-CoA carboxylase alpha subunit
MKPLFRRVLIANRGEIAVRIIRACRELGIEPVAVHSDVDADALHVRAADMSVRIGPASPAESYLAIDRIIDAARRSGAEAIHPGYGFLSERADFAEACEAADLIFIGPAPRTLAGLGDKLAARRSAREAGIDIVPGTFEPAPIDRTDDLDAVIEAARRIGGPLLVKAAGGGGGRGMRRVDRPEDLPAALVHASHEARAAFGDGAVYLERYVEVARHVEVQLLGDAAGTIVALGERDCSVQRRHQKVVEESPAPGLTRGQRADLHARAVAIARAVGLRNAATAEFLLTPEGAFWFLEVNARLQVEHGITELVCGIDLVHEQIRIAAGVPLTEEVVAAAGRAADPERHAIEWRISAEDPARDFGPVPGTITTWIEPGGPGVRMDSGVAQGTHVPSEYDPLLAKLMVVAPDRDRALARSARALDELAVGGIQTTLPFHRWLVRHEPFRDARLRTDMVATDWDGPAQRAGALEQAVRAASQAEWGRRSGSTAPPPARHDDASPQVVIGVAPGSARSPWRATALREGTERRL